MLYRWISPHFLMLIFHMNTTRPHWWQLNIDDKKPLPEPMMTQIYVAIWRHQAAMSSYHIQHIKLIGAAICRHSLTVHLFTVHGVRVKYNFSELRCLHPSWQYHCGETVTIIAVTIIQDGGRRRQWVRTGPIVTLVRNSILFYMYTIKGNHQSRFCVPCFIGLYICFLNMGLWNFHNMVVTYKPDIGDMIVTVQELWS